MPERRSGQASVVPPPILMMEVKMLSWRTLSILTLLLLIGIAVCADKAAALPVRADLSADEQKIRELGQKWDAAVRAKDAVACAGFYASDGAMLNANAPLARGTVAITAAWQRLLSMRNVNLTFASTQLIVSNDGDMAYDVGTYELSFDDNKGMVKDVGKYVTVWTKVGGEWKVAADISNSDGAMK
ncbi:MULTISPECIES: YybH family protein [Bradyrhizobium]|uniref:YybH family protein n=2 Tax=Bradyrhizobium TaxID=374 RepID=UPI0009B75D3A|nr:DUF4440 domain-containing protein [Bradyrhizobium elkanii]RZN32052.1 DUF4440 domain-containing protein [Bradyrhizobium sp. Leo121]